MKEKGMIYPKPCANCGKEVPQTRFKGGRKFCNTSCANKYYKSRKKNG